MRICDELKTAVKLCMFDLYGTIVDTQAASPRPYGRISPRRAGVVSQGAWSPGGGGRISRTQ